ncbi:sialic acid-binding Ig-like lectin 12 isoform X2 [Antennarius striatus]|uniref:sialic acid-binding Ig-like lectin 12 isoform X2 n=1 Tax=Antennarius striatus TaxID=241820 RepID=UPI0035B4144E
MLVLIWATLLFPARRDNAAIPGCLMTFMISISLGRSALTTCEKNICITLPRTEITAEAGLCVEIPCSMNYRGIQNIEWNKCDSSFQCNSKIFNIFSMFVPESRVFLLDLNLRSCSIIINNLTESDSGLYKLRVYTTSEPKSPNGIQFNPGVNITVTALTQTPSLSIPSLTEDVETTLTCIAPGLCSGSSPNFTWTWRGRGKKDSYITGNLTTFRTQNVTAFTQRHSSTLTFTPLVTKHDDTEITCKVTFANNINTEMTETLTVWSVPKILKSSGCRVQSKVLTCVCISQGNPAPFIDWPLLENLTEFSVINTHTGYSVNSTIVISAKDHNSTVRCVSKSEDGKAHIDMDIVKYQKAQEGTQEKR